MTASMMLVRWIHNVASRHPKCVMSLQVVEEYRRRGFDFLLNAFDDPAYLERLTGLSELHASTMDEEVRIEAHCHIYSKPLNIDTWKIMPNY